MARQGQFPDVNPNRETFTHWLERTNKISNAMENYVVTVARSGTEGDVTTGNAHIEGILSANTLVAKDGLRGGTVSSSDTLNIRSNTQFNSNVVVVNSVTTLANTVIGNNLADILKINSSIDSNIIPNDDGTRNLGSSGKKWNVNANNTTTTVLNANTLSIVNDTDGISINTKEIELTKGDNKKLRIFNKDDYVGTQGITQYSGHSEFFGDVTFKSPIGARFEITLSAAPTDGAYIVGDILTATITVDEVITTAGATVREVISSTVYLINTITGEGSLEKTSSDAKTIAISKNDGTKTATITKAVSTRNKIIIEGDLDVRGNSGFTGTSGGLSEVPQDLEIQTIIVSGESTLNQTTFGGNVLVSANDTYNIGNTTHMFNDVFADNIKTGTISPLVIADGVNITGNGGLSAVVFKEGGTSLIDKYQVKSTALDNLLGKTFPGVIVGTTDTQTISNKTINNSIINSSTNIDAGVLQLSSTSVDLTKTVTGISQTGRIIFLGGKIQIRDGSNTREYSHDGITSGIHGISGSFVGTSDTQTLTNKTLTTPTIERPTLRLKNALTPATANSGFVVWDNTNERMRIRGASTAGAGNPFSGPIRNFSHDEVTSGIHGISGSFVGTTDTQTVTNKTINDSIINNTTINNSVNILQSTIRLKNVTGNYSASSSTNGEIVYKTDTNEINVINNNTKHVFKDIDSIFGDGIELDSNKKLQIKLQGGTLNRSASGIKVSDTFIYDMASAGQISAGGISNSDRIGVADTSASNINKIITYQNLRYSLAQHMAGTGLTASSGRLNATTPAIPSTIDNARTTAVDGIKIWIGTQAQYDAISSKDSSTLYFITG